MQNSKRENPVDEIIKLAHLFVGFNDYQIESDKTATYPKDKALEYCGLGLAGESGEIANKIKKILRGDLNLHDHETKMMIRDEMGDTLWYIAQLARVFDIDMSDIAVANVMKLRDRLERGTLHGTGDNR